MLYDNFYVGFSLLKINHNVLNTLPIYKGNEIFHARNVRTREMNIKKTPTLWIHKVGVHIAVYLLHQFDGCEGFAFYRF